MKIRTSYLNILLISAFTISLSACGGGDVTTETLDNASTGDSNKNSTNNTDGSSSIKLIAIPDGIETTKNTQIIFDVIANDEITNTSVDTLVIDYQPKNGNLFIDSNYVITYTPEVGFMGVDDFTYKITDTEGNYSSASVTILVKCEIECAYNVNVSWDTHFDPGVIGYYVYYGSAPNQYDEKIWVGNIVDYTIPMTQAGTFYFAVTAVDSEVSESGYSTEVEVYIPI